MVKKKTNDEFLAEVEGLVGTEYTFLEPYVNNRTTLKVRHNKCGKVFKVTPYRFLLKGVRCPTVMKANKIAKLSMSPSEFSHRLESKYGAEYSILGKYINTKTHLLVRHNVCGTEYMTTPSNLLRGHGCNICAQKLRDKKRKLTDKEFKNKVRELTGDEYTFLEPYSTNAHVELKVKHNKCGTVYSVKPYNFLYNNRRCPYCNTSSGELYIQSYLDKHKIKYETQKTFPWCKDKHLLSYDFYIPEFNTLVEYQGAQHYGPIEFFGSDYYSTQKKHDAIKRSFAHKEGMKLLEISYRKYNQSLVSQTLTRYFKGIKQGDLNQK